MRLKDLHQGRRVKIVKGNYSGRFATFVENAGLLGISARVAVDGDNRPYCTLRLASLVDANLSVPSPGTTPSNGSPTARDNQTDLETVIRKIQEIEELMTSLKLDLEKIRSSSVSQ
jgi:hypothetical protein